MIAKTVFLSYRRKDGAWALSIYQWLTQRGYDVFIDYENIASGAFASAIDENILARAHFLVVLSPSTLDRCDRPSDWLRHEVETAMRHGRNIVPIMVDGFSFESAATASKLTGLLVHLSAYNGLEMTLATFQDKMQRLADRFLNVALENIVHPIGVKAVQIDATLHPASAEAVRVAKYQQAKADAAPLPTSDECEATIEYSVALSDAEVPVSKRWAVHDLILWAKSFWALISVALIIFIVVRTQFMDRHASVVHPVDRIGRNGAYQRELFNDLRQSVVRLRVRTINQTGEKATTFGSAFYVSDDSKLVTAAHLIDNLNTESIEVNLNNGTWSPAVVQLIDNERDIGVLALKSPIASKAIRLDGFPTRIGEELFIVGWPPESEVDFIPGNVVSLDLRRSRISVGVGPGFPGAPVVSSSGRVVGMIIDGTVEGKVSFFVPASEFGKFIEISK